MKPGDLVRVADKLINEEGCPEERARLKSWTSLVYDVRDGFALPDSVEVNYLYPDGKPVRAYIPCESLTVISGKQKQK